MAQYDVLAATSTDLELLLREGKVTTQKIVSGYLEQIDKYNGYLHAVISTPPRDKVMERARELDHERFTGRDNVATDPNLGMETTAGTYALVGSRVREAAPLVKQLLKAGAIIIGKANLSELSNYRGSQMPNEWSAVGGLTQSPYVIGGKWWDDGYGGHSAVGGSSSGSCAGVAAGFAPVSIGTDTNASIMVPATRNDVYAMKPTLGLVSQDGIYPISADFDSAGPIARCARDVAVVMDAIVNPEKVGELPGSTYTSYLTGSFNGTSLSKSIGLFRSTLESRLLLRD